MKHVGIEIKFYNLDTFKKQIDVNFIYLDSELVDLNYKVASLIFCHFWRSIYYVNDVFPCFLSQPLCVTFNNLSKCIYLQKIIFISIFTRQLRKVTQLNKVVLRFAVGTF